MIAIHEALATIDAQVSPLATQRLPLLQAQYRVLAEPAISLTDLPPFDQSAVDGYAVNSADTTDAPIKLPVSGTIAAAAQRKQPELKAGTAMRIYTGGLVPDHADTIVRQELTDHATGGKAHRIQIKQAVAADTDFRHRGEELQAGSELAPAQTRLHAGLIGALANSGVGKLQVYKQPRIVVLITGDEITAADRGLKPGQVYDANGPTLAATLAHWGYAQVTLRYVSDQQQAVRKALKRAFKEADLVITTGGVSVGDLDWIPRVTEQLGGQPLFWKVAQKPGKPLYFARHDNGYLIGLPGNPAAVLVNLHVFVRRILDRLENLQTPAPLWQSGVVLSEVAADAKRDRWLRVAVRQDSQQRTVLEPLGLQASHMLSNLNAATGLAHVPGNDKPVAAGSVLQWLAIT